MDTAVSTDTNSTAPVAEVIRTKILLTGLRKCGKTSIQEVLFKGLPPKDAFFIEPTTKVVKTAYDTVIPLEIWDCPGSLTIQTLPTPLSQFPTIVFVIDIQDHHQQPIARLVELIITAYQENQNVNLEVFVHKAEALSEEYKIDNFRHIQQRVLEELDDYDFGHIPVNFYLTSIHDHSLQDAFSRVVHKLVDSLPYIEDLLNVFCGNSQATKVFLFDVKSRLYVATDASPVDSATHSLCSDFLLTLNSFGPLYKSVQASTFEERRTLFPSQLVQQPSAPMQASPSASPHSPSSSDKGKLPDADQATDPVKALFYPSASTSLSPGSTETTVTCHLITPQLALLALIPTQTFESRRGLVEYNVVYFREAVQEIWQVEREARTRG